MVDGSIKCNFKLAVKVQNLLLLKCFVYSVGKTWASGTCSRIKVLPTKIMNKYATKIINFI